MRIKRQSGNFGYGSPLPNVRRSTLPRIHINNREGVNKAAQSHALNTGTTDSDGRVMAEHLFSRDLESHGGPGGEVSVGLGSVPYVNNRIGMGWGNVEWRMGENGEKEWDYNFFSAMEDHNIWLYTKVMFRDDYEDDDKDLPLTGHSMKFVVTRLQVREKNENGKIVERIYTTVPLDPYSVSIDSYDGPQAPEIILVDEIDATDYIEFSPQTVEDDNNGVYKTQAKILENPDQTLRHFIVELEDQGVHQPKPTR